MAAGGEISAFLPLWFTEVAIGLGYAVACFVLFNWIETQARRRGTLETVWPDFIRCGDGP